MVGFVKATKQQAKGRMALIGPAGAGKTYSALAIASHMGKKIAVIDTEHGSASKYADIFEFDTMNIDNFHPQNYIDGIKAAADAGYDVLVIDSLSHCWMGKGGELELVDDAAKRSKGNSYVAWKEVTPLHNQLIEAILQSNVHIIATMRAKTEYSQEKDENGKTQIKKLGMAPIQRDGLEFEFDVIADMDTDNNFIVSKSRCPQLNKAVFNKPSKDVADIFLNWLGSGEPPITCEVCDGIISAATISGKSYTPQQLAELSKKNYKKQMCKTCVMAAAEAKKQEQAAGGE